MCLMMMESFIIVFTGMLSLLVSFGLTGIYPCIAGAQGRPRQQGGWAHDTVILLTGMSTILLSAWATPS